jgi:hypothetical protein
MAPPPALSVHDVIAVYAHGARVGINQVVLLESIVKVVMVQHTGEHYTTFLADSVIGTRAFTLDNNLFGLRNYDGGWKMAKDATQPADNNLGLITAHLRPRPRRRPSLSPRLQPVSQ